MGQLLLLSPALSLSVKRDDLGGCLTGYHRQRRKTHEPSLGPVSQSLRSVYQPRLGMCGWSYTTVRASAGATLDEGLTYQTDSTLRMLVA